MAKRADIYCPEDCPALNVKDSKCDGYRVYLVKSDVVSGWEKCYQCRNKREDDAVQE